MIKVGKLTHYLPPSWSENAHSDEVRNEFSSFYQVGIFLWLMEILSIFTTPLILLFTLPPCSEDIITYLRENSTTVRYSNYRYLVCKFSLLDLENDGDESYGSKISSIHRSSIRQDLLPKYGKLEASFIQFQNDYPSWKPRLKGQSEYINSYIKSL